MLMNATRTALVCLALTACQDEPAPATGPTPPPVQQGVAAYVTVDNLTAQPGQTVRVRVQVQVGTQQDFKLGSYTGRLRFDPAKIEFKQENTINDGLRVANPLGAAQGEIRFAGASATGFTQLVLYDASFQVKTAGYVQSLQLTMEELSAALSLQNLQAQVRVNPQVFLSRQPNR
jgi:hypothetical protein